MTIRVERDGVGNCDSTRDSAMAAGYSDDDINNADFCWWLACTHHNNQQMMGGEMAKTTDIEVEGRGNNNDRWTSAYATIIYED